MTLRLLLVEDDAAVRRSVAELLAEEGVEVHPTETAEQALARIREIGPHAVLSDVRMPGLDGVALLEVLRERAPDVAVVLMTAYDDMPTVVRAMRQGAFEFLVKPLSLADVRGVIARLRADRDARVRAGGEIRPEELPASGVLVGRDPRMLTVYKRVGQLAASRVTVLVRGETGTGKGVIARAIHEHSPNAAEPFIGINCTALPETLLESELFGHVRGAFTGAVADRRGRFALAGRGTIFLDEVGDTSPEFQAKLLRVLEEREYFPLGGERAERTEARVIAATHRDLERLVEEGRFREDLYYRLRVVEVHLPALRERPGDLSLLADHFVRKAGRELDRPAAPVLGEDALLALGAHQWPGNVRELEHCLTRAVVLAPGRVIHAEHLGLAHAHSEAEAQDASFPSLERVEAEHVARALAATGGNRTRAAVILGISKPRLYRIIDRHGMS